MQIAELSCTTDAPTMTEDDWMVDPLDGDDDGRELTLTQRQLVRIALVATEVGARFQRDREDGDPLEWMLAPSRTFDGRAPIEACGLRRDCIRAVVLHGLGIRLDAAPHTIDAIIAGEPSFEFDDDHLST